MMTCMITFKNRNDLIYSDTVSLVHDFKQDDINEWIKQNRQQFYLSESVSDHIKIIRMRS